MVAALTDTPLDTLRVQPKAPAAQAEGAGKSRGLFGADGFSFWDLLDIVNPLQHIPVVSTIYRAITGDTIDPGARIAGGTLFGGPIGMAVSLVSAMVQEDTGKDPGEHALAVLGLGPDENAPPDPAVAVAKAPPPPADRIPPELLAAMQPPPRPEPNRPELKLSVKPSFADEEDQGEAQIQPDERRAARNSPQHGISQQGMPQQSMVAPLNAASSQADLATAMIAARAHGPQPGARAAATPVAAPQVIDGRTWFPAFPQGGGGAPTRGVGAQAVGQQNAVAKFGVARGASHQGAGSRGDAQSQADWAEKAAAAYQKYSDMQQRDRQKALDVRY